MGRVHVEIVAHTAQIAEARLTVNATVADQATALTLFNAAKALLSGAVIDSASAQYIPDQMNL